MSIVLTDMERERLERRVRRHSSSQMLAQRSRIVFACAGGLGNKEVAAAVGVHPVTSSKWRHRLATDRLEDLSDPPRPGAVRTISDETIEVVVVGTLVSVPKHAMHWSTRDLAKTHRIGKTTVAEIWRTFGLKLWEENTFKISPGPDLVEKTRDIVGLYPNPPILTHTPSFTCHSDSRARIRRAHRMYASSII